ncbi:hypothetical protein D3C80_2105630 [compost metagenome]
MPLTAVQATDAMAHVHPVVATNALHRALAHRKYQCIALFKAHYHGPRLHPGALLGEHELATCEVYTGC